MRQCPVCGPVGGRGMSLQGKINSRIDLPGVCVQIVDYRWHRGAEIVEVEPHHLLRRRSNPTQLGVSAMVDNSERPFGQLMFFPAHVPFSTSAAANDEYVQTITCRFDRDWFSAMANIPGEWDKGDLTRCCDVRNSRIDQAIQWMGNEVAAPGLASTLLIESLASAVAVEIARHFGEPGRQLRARTRDGKLQPSHLNRVVEFIESTIQRCPTIDEIAATCNVSPAHLRRAFKNSTGHTIHDYVESVRLTKAKALLSETDLPLKEISFRLGFAVSSTFSSAFRKLQGETPSGFRFRTRQ